MSTSRPADVNEKHDKELDAELKRPDTARGLKVKFTVDDSFDIPYVGGVSKDGRTVYIDRHFPKKVAVKGKSVDIRPGLIRHEQVEGALLRTGRYKYPGAHEIATAAENRVYRQMGLDPAAVEKVYPKYVKTDRLEKLERVPKDLEMKPYTDAPVDTALLKRIRACWAQQEDE